VQEYADGEEFAVDTVAMDGDIKVVALWRYRKFSANGAPFVYQCTELVSSAGERESEICNYCVDILKAQNLQWGPTHTEIKYTSRFGPALIEINARWHAQNTFPVMVQCLNVDAVSAALDAYFDPESFRTLPRRPDRLLKHGMIVHLVSYSEGVIREVRHLDLIRSLPSLVLLDMPLDVGDRVSKTVDIRTDSGYVLLCNDNNAQLQSDFEYIIQLQKTMFDVEDEEEVDHKQDRSDEMDSAIVEEITRDNFEIGIEVNNMDNMMEVEDIKEDMEGRNEYLNSASDIEKIDNSIRQLEYDVDEEYVSETRITSFVKGNGAVLLSRLRQVALSAIMKVSILYLLGSIFVLTFPLFVKAPS